MFRTLLTIMPSVSLKSLPKTLPNIHSEKTYNPLGSKPLEKKHIGTINFKIKTLRSFGELRESP